MSLWLTETVDQALVAHVIRRANLIAKEKNGYVGRIAVQKIVYFLKARGVPTSYRFDIYHYGPYSDTLNRDVEFLAADEVILNISSRPERYYDYAPGPLMDELTSLHSNFIVTYTNEIDEVVSAFAPLSATELELTATLDYMYRRIRGTGISVPGKQRVIEAFVDVKKDKFTREQVEKTYDSMYAAGVFAG